MLVDAITATTLTTMKIIICAVKESITNDANVVSTPFTLMLPFVSSFMIRTTYLSSVTSFGILLYDANNINSSVTTEFDATSTLSLSTHFIKV